MPSISRRGSISLPSLCLAAGAVLLSYLALPMLRREVYTTADLVDFHLPLRAFYARCLAAWESPAWCPGLFCGYYVHGEGQAGMAHPVHWLLYSSFPLDVALNAEWLLNYPFAFAGMAWFLRRRGLDANGSAFGGLAFAFCGFNVLRYLHLNYLEPFVHLPWLLASADVLIRSGPRQARWATGGLALLTASTFLLGQPQIVYFAGLAELAYLAWRLGAGPNLARRRLPLWALAKCLGVLIAGVQLLPTLDVKARSVRDVGSEAFSESFSIHPANTAQFVAPYFFKSRSLGDRDGTGRRWHGDDDSLRQEYGLYSGSLPWALLAWTLARGRDRAVGRGLVAWAVAIGGVALLLAFGRYTPLYRVYLTVVPLSDLFRGPSRFVGIVHFAMAVVSAVGFADLASRREPVRWARLWPIAVPWLVSMSVTAVLSLDTRGRPEAPLWVSSAKGVLLGPLLAGVAAVGVALAARGVKLALPGLVLFAAADQAMFARDYLGLNRTMGVPAIVATMAPHPPGGPTDGRIATGDRPDLALMVDRRAVGGYVALTPRRSLNYAGTPGLRISGAAWVRDEAGRWAPVAGPLPRARLVTGTVASDDPRAEVGRVDPAAVAVVAGPMAIDGGEPGAASVVSDRPGRIRVATVSGTRQLLVLSESFHDGWRLKIDGREAPVVRVYGDFLGVVVGPGRHAVDFEFRPSSLRLGLVASATGLALLIVLMVVPLPWASRATPADLPGPAGGVGRPPSNRRGRPS